jgi:hypothetical protein
MLHRLIDEDVHGDIVDGLRLRQPALDLVRVQDAGLRHTPDPIIPEWAAQEGRRPRRRQVGHFATKGGGELDF